MQVFFHAIVLCILIEKLSLNDNEEFTLNATNSDKSKAHHESHEHYSRSFYLSPCRNTSMVLYIILRRKGEEIIWRQIEEGIWNWFSQNNEKWDGRIWNEADIKQMVLKYEITFWMINWCHSRTTSFNWHLRESSFSFFCFRCRSFLSFILFLWKCSMRINWKKRRNFSHCKYGIYFLTLALFYFSFLDMEFQWHF